MSKDTIRRVIRTYLITVIGLWIPGLLGWINDVTKWARDEGATPFPDAHGLLYLAVAAITAAFPAAVNLIWNSVEDATGKGFLRSVPAVLPRNAAGAISTRTIAIGALVLAALVVLILVL